MTESEWLAATDPEAMASSPILYPFWGDAPCAKVARSTRKRELCSIFWLRSVWDFLVSEHSRKYVEVVERFVESEATEEEVDEACWMAKDAGEDSSVTTDLQIWATEAAYDMGGLCESIRWLTLCADESQQSLCGGKMLADTLRDVFGNPFRPVTIESRWLTETVVGIASCIYTERAFERMPILADALQEAGCENEVVLNHCREPGEHVRGCWVVDLLLGKQ